MRACEEIPRVVIAAPASGTGKTTVAVGLIRALRARGLKVAAFKCGPDYLDPTYHARAAGQPAHNLDGWMMGREAVRSTFARAAAGADIAVVEGVMGLFDGASPTGEEGSTAEIAKWLGAAVLLVVDASGMARTIAAIAHGFARFDSGLDLAGLIANRAGSPGHIDLLKRALSTPPLVGGLVAEKAEMQFPERHLGLRTADEGAVPEALLDAWGERIARGIDLEAVLRVARHRPPELSVPPAPSGRARAPGLRPQLPCRIGLAHDAAFHFYYEDNLRQLETLGAELVRFSPIADARLPDVDGLIFGGGYPEVHAEALARNQAMRTAIMAFAARRRPIYAECGGLMYLASTLRTLDGRRHPMVGLIAGEAVMAERLQALGYVEVETQARSILGPPGLRFRGHQFRYSELRGVAPELEQIYTVRKRRGGEVAREGYAPAGLAVVASYVHAHWASNPLVAENLVAACAAGRSP